MRNIECVREEGEESEAAPWPESILILVNINRFGSVTSAHTHTLQKKTIDQIPPKAKLQDK